MDADALNIVVEDEELEDDETSQLYEHYRIVADKGQKLLRVDKFLLTQLSGTSRNRVQKAADAGFIMANGRPVKRSYKVKPEDVIQVMLDRPHYENKITPEDIPLNIVYEDGDLMVINKPAGMVVHPGFGNWNGTMLNAIAWHLKDMPQYDINDPEIRTRVDFWWWRRRRLRRQVWVCSSSTRPRNVSTMRWCGAILRKMQDA